MKEDQTNNRGKIQMPVSAAFSTALVPTEIELRTAIEMPLAPQDESLTGAKGEIADAPPLVEQVEGLAEITDEIIDSPPSVGRAQSLVDAKDEIAVWVREVSDATARSLELSKRLDDLLARPIRWFHADPDDKRTALDSKSN